MNKINYLNHSLVYLHPDKTADTYKNSDKGAYVRLKICEICEKCMVQFYFNENNINETVMFFGEEKPTPFILTCEEAIIKSILE